MPVNDTDDQGAIAMADDAKQAWNDVGDRFASLGNRLSEKYRESGSGGDPGAAETQRKLQETAKEVGDQLSRAFDALGATIRDEEAKADLKRALNAFGEALGATFDEAGHAIRRTVGSSGDTPPVKPEEPPAKPEDPPAGPDNDG